MPSDFVHLHVHTEFSLLDGQSQIKKLVARAEELDMKAMGITDHGVMFGAIDFFRACIGADIKPIIGMEAYLAPRKMTDRDARLDKRPYHMLLLAKNMTGYQNLLKMASAAQLEGYYYRPRIDREFMAAHSEGIIATSGCLAAEIPRMVEDGDDSKARELIGWYQDVFGAENFFLELQNHNIDLLHTLNNWIYDYRQSGHSDVQLLATNDVHYVRKSDWQAHDTLLCIQTGAIKSEENRMRMSPQDSYYLKSTEEMLAEFKGAPESLIRESFANSLKIAEMTDLDLSTKGYHLPKFPVPVGDEGSYLRYLVEMGMAWRFNADWRNDKVLRERIERELGIIHNMGFDTYFLIVWDLCEFARHADIWWNVRGSGAGSLVAYSLGITSIDPIQNSLLFERFLNPGRVSMPDIDLDYPDDRRGEMIAYAARKYGEDKVAAIITFGTMGAKAAVRDVARALNVDLPKVNKAVALIPQEAKQKKIREYVDMNPELLDMYNADPELRQVIDTAIELQGMTRHASTHAAGVIISDAPLVQYLPLHRITGTDPSNGALKAVTQFPMETAESIGLLKVDFLGLSTLTILRKACQLIERHQDINYTMETIPYRHDDPKVSDQQKRMLDETFEMMGHGDTVGVFQVESGGMQQMLRGMRPKVFENIIAGISLYRPGPMDFIPTYNNRLHDEEETVYLHPKLEPILRETYGICITGDSIVIDSTTGNRHRIDELEAKVGDFAIQGVDDCNRPVVSRVSHWFDNGIKPVYQLKLRNGATIKATADHKFLTEYGWVALKDLELGRFIATPNKLLEPQSPFEMPREKIRVLAYLIADGGVSNHSQVNFFNKNDNLLEEYLRCLQVFEDVKPSILEQVREVKRISIRHKDGRYVNSLLAWMREIGFKNPPGQKRGGLQSHEKFVPDFIFTLADDDIIYFLASLWDCDGYLGRKMCHYKTISKQLALDVQTLLLRVGIPSVIHSYDYENTVRHNQTAYQLMVYDTQKLANYLQPYMLSHKKNVECIGQAKTFIDRQDFITEIKSVTQMSARGLMAHYGIDRQHFYKARQHSKRISVDVVKKAVDQIALPNTQNLVNVWWEEIVAIEPAGEERVYDITVDGIHNFVANNILVHNCVYQEQIMQIAGDLFGYELGEADLMRRAVSKKKTKDLLKHKEIFMERGPENDISAETAEAIFDMIEFFANYGFNKCVVGSTEIVDADTGRQVTIEQLFKDEVTVENTLSLNTDTLKLEPHRITDVMANGVKPVYRLTTQLGRSIEATANHPFYTFDGWCNLEDIQVGKQIAVPRQISVSNSNQWDRYKLIVLGHLLAEGNLCHTTGVYYYTADDEQLADYVCHMEMFENSVASVSWHRATHSVYSKRRLRSMPQGLVEWIKSLGLWGHDAYTKFIPDEVFELSNSQIGLLVSRMWEGDGHLNLKGRSVYYATSSERLVHQLQHLLLRLDIISKIRRVEFPYKDGRIGYQLFVTGNDNLALFSEYIASNFVSAKRQDLLSKLILVNPASSGVKDVIPVEVKHIVRQQKDLVGKKWTDISLETGVSVSTFSRVESGDKVGFTRDVIQIFADYFNSDELCRYANNDIYWDKVVSIEYVGEQPTYDLTIEGTHNFVANDIIVHNSHASDYAVITVQTGYLKCHYPEEYMTALLIVQRDDSTKVATFLEECRRLQIPVLPPDVNYSQLDFDIEKQKDGKRGIRFGLAAVKNAGVPALEYLIDARGNRPFDNLKDFCQRVDLRKVGKRTMESLIKVGALVKFGTRSTLLAAMERIISYSGSYHKDKEIGQMNMFGDSSEIDDDLLKNLPLMEEYKPREMLKWEKELLGLYVTGRPVDRHIDVFRNQKLQEVAVFKSGGENIRSESVRIAGEIVAMRKITTKNNKLMAILQLEDWHESANSIEVVLFPETYHRVMEYFADKNADQQFGDAEKIMAEGEIVAIKGKLDFSRGEAQIIADDVSIDFETFRADGDVPIYDNSEPDWSVTADISNMPDIPEPDYDEETGEIINSSSHIEPPAIIEGAIAPATQGASVPTPAVEPQFGGATGYSKASNGSNGAHATNGTNGHHNNDDDPEPEWVSDDDLLAMPDDNLYQNGQKRLIKVYMDTSKDPDKDRRRLRRLHGIFVQYPGNDQFTIIVRRPKDSLKLNFPNDTTGFCDELMRDLMSMVESRDNIEFDSLVD